MRVGCANLEGRAPGGCELPQVLSAELVARRGSEVGLKPELLAASPWEQLGDPATGTAWEAGKLQQQVLICNLIIELHSTRRNTF